MTPGTPRPQNATTAVFGSVTAPFMVTSPGIHESSFGPPEVQPVGPLDLHPAAHVLHYGSACFEGLKAHRGADGVVRLFRPTDHADRMRGSAEALCLPVPPHDLLMEMMQLAVRANLDTVPPPPGALYVRPTLIGTDPNIGSAVYPSTAALLFVIASPVGEYIDSTRPVTVRTETVLPRSTPQFGRVKAGANYAMALRPTVEARKEDGADQVLFAPGGDIQETGAANFILLDDRSVVTKPLDGSFLHGITRDSVLRIAAQLGYQVSERSISTDELPAWAEQGGEAALVGTAAVLAGIGTVIHEGRGIVFGDRSVGQNTKRLREALVEVQRGESEDRWGWTWPVHRSDEDR